MNLKNKLNRFKSHISTNGADTNTNTNTNTKTNRNMIEETSIPYLDKWELEGVTPYFIDNQYCLVRKVKFPLDFQHGNYLLGDYIRAVKLWNEKDVNHPLSTKGYLPNQLFFFDTETTGLGGGVGNTIFILGHAHLTENEFILTQHILPHPGAEVPLYHSFLSDVNYRTLVTYNGKSFDWPQVKTRHTLVREHVPKLPEFGHFDLYHGARRIWKHKLERMKLAIVEKEILGVNRIDDVPGFLAPMIYFDYVERKDPEGMLKILKHNEIDILSLITLYTHLSFQILGVDKSQTMEEKYELGKWFSSLGEISFAKEVYHDIEKEERKVSVASQLQLGYIYKKQKKLDESLLYFEAVTQSNLAELRLEACVEAAKILEHHKKDFPKALTFCETALKLLNSGSSHKSIEVFDVNKRKERIIKKIYFQGKRIKHQDSSN
jgi:uncharacterized protein